MRRYFTYSNRWGSGGFRMDMVICWSSANSPGSVDVGTLAGGHMLTRAEFDAMLRLAESDWWLQDLDAPPATGVVQ